MSIREDRHGLREWRDGWPLVLASAMGIGIGTYYLASVGVVMKPLQQAFGWTRGEITAVAAINTTMLVVGSPLLGHLVDRFGPRRLVLPGVIAHCLAFAAVGFTGPSIWSWYAAWTVSGMCGLVTSSTSWTAAVASRFEKHRGLALGATLAGHGLTAAVIPALSVLALMHFGWRGVYFTLAAFGLAAAFPLSYLFFFEGKRVGEQRRGAQAFVAPDTAGYGLGQAMRQLRYWKIGLALCIGAGAAGAFQLHLVPMLTDAGIPLSRAAAYMALLGPTTIAGRLIGGYLMDRIFAPLVAAVVFGLPLINCFLIPHLGHSAALVPVVVGVVGLSAGVEIDTIAVLASRYFGLRSYGRVYAPLTAMFSLGFGYAASLGGVIYDRFGNYDVLLQILAACLVVSVLLLLTLGPYPDFARDPAKRSARNEAAPSTGASGDLATADSTDG